MKNVRHKNFAVGDREKLEKVLLLAGELYKVHENGVLQADEQFYDTFDWLLYDKGYLLKKSGGQLLLTTVDDVMIAGQPGGAAHHFFSWDLNQGEVRQTIAPIADIRAMSEIVLLKRTTTQYDLRNKDGKTVARLFLEEGVAHGNGCSKGYGKGYGGDCEQNLEPLLRVEQLKGYENPFSRVVRCICRAGLQEPAGEATMFLRGLSAIGRQVFDYSSNFDIQLEQDCTVRQAFRRICLQLVESMERNYTGVLEDIDSEFLHDFRVAVRRTRSLISQLKKYLPAERILFFQQELKWLGQITGPVRDLDVYLLSREEYKAMVPEQLHDGLNAFFADLAAERRTRLEEMRKGLRSQRYVDLMAGWKEFIDSKEEKEHWAAAEQPCRPVAVKRIRKRFKKIVEKGSGIDSTTPDEQLHMLRIDGKKLRYLLEFFRSLFDNDDIEYFRKQLKKLQNNLGDFNDIAVQLEMLARHRDRLSGKSKRSVNIAAAIGGLITHLSVEHTALRQEFEQVFAGFSATKNIKKFYAAID